MSYRNIFNTKQPIGASLLSSYPGQTSCPSLLGIYWKLVQEVTEPLHMKYDAANCGKKSCESSLRSTAPNRVRANLSKQLYHNFLSLTRVVNNVRASMHTFYVSIINDQYKWLNEITCEVSGVLTTDVYPMQWMGMVMIRCGMLGESVRNMKELTVKMETVALIGEGG